MSGDKFRLGEVLDTGVKLLGRTTWELFSRIFPRRDDDFSRRRNAAGVPTLLGKGRRLFDGVSAPVELELVSSDDAAAG